MTNERLECQNCGAGYVSKDPNEVRVVTMTGDPWVDFGYFLEATGFMLKQASDATGKSVDELVKYSADYLKGAANDYTVDM